MLSIRYGKGEDTVLNVDAVFNNNYEDEWFDDSLVRQMVLDVDKSEVISPNCIQSPVLGQISPRDLSGGVKALILSLKTDMEIWATACGDNCAKWFLEIAKIKDITISISHLFNFPSDEFNFADAATGKEYNNYNEFIFSYYGRC